MGWRQSILSSFCHFAFSIIFKRGTDDTYVVAVYVLDCHVVTVGGCCYKIRYNKLVMTF